MRKQDQIWKPIIIGLSIVIPVAVAVLFLLPEDMKLNLGNANLRSLPFFHATLNGSTAILLLVGKVLIKKKQVTWHRFSMLAAFVLSSVFLISYVIYHSSTPDSKYLGDMGYIYYPILISHIVLSMAVLPLALFAIYRGLTNEIQKHRKIVKWTYPIWLYVAVTGVLVYVFMAPYYVH
ncbi:DUF420 domain-containing protein [Phaeocystidibacter marisrubri]|uniref:DUF420 domain-containing protein n=1 Tax=Phaeocystidibacter marisrubri TaxID=1577780 RepID=A0A6L3ZID4_9FLAO|nr:DUF420 domain-containing protein [Phaeocystidibacter marisrubri]KAB2816940.1 DUF420 domain-containing protein [Phaeocystidibacter marisrubri]GGH77509.1 putative membrane protein YozB [Phaeocystidibacter marisrubri]